MHYFKVLFDKYKNLNEVLKASVWFFAVGAIDRGISIITQPIINRIQTLEEVGTYGVYNSWLSVFSILATFNLFCGVLETYLTNNKENKDQVVGSLNVLSLIISLTFFGAIICFIKPISALLSLKPAYLVVMWISIIGTAMVQFWAVPKRFDYSYKTYSLLTLVLFSIKSILSVVLTYLMVEDRVMGRILGLSVPTLLCGVVLFSNTLKKTDLSQICLYWKPALKFNLPLIPHYLSSVVLSSSDRVMIEKLSGASEAGLYSVAYTYSSLCLMVFSAINSAYNPFSMMCIKEKRYEELSKSTETLIVCSALFSLAVTFLAPEGLYILGGKKYIPALPLIPVLSAGVFMASFYFIFSNVEFVYERTTYIFPITVFGAIINLGLNWLFIPKIGYTAAAYTTFIGYLFIAGVHCWLSIGILSKDIYKIKRLCVVLILFLALSFSAQIMYNLHFLFRYITIIIILFCAVRYTKKNRDFFVRKKV